MLLLVLFLFSYRSREAVRYDEHGMAAWCTGNTLVSITVSTLIGDCLLTDKPSWLVPTQLGQLSLPSLRGRLIDCRPVAGVKAGHVHLCRVAGMASDDP